MNLKKIAVSALSVLMMTACNKTYVCENQQGIKTGEVKARSQEKATAMCPGGTASIK